MRIAYLDCFSGMSGDMFLGALIDAGVPLEKFEKTIAALDIGARLEVSRVNRSGISAVKADVYSHGEKDLPREVYWEQKSAPRPATAHTHSHEPIQLAEHNYGVATATESRTGASAPHYHGRHLSEIRNILNKAEIGNQAKTTAIAIFEALGAAEAKIHNVEIEKVHFHEVGAVDAMVDIVCASVGFEALGVDELICSSLNVGGGTVNCAHGTFPVPAPATLELLKGAPTYSSGIEAELVTPTGAAIVKILACRFAAFPAMKIEKAGYGAGTRDFPGYPNVVRLTLGEAEDKSAHVESNEIISVLEANLDDLNPQIFGYVVDRLFAEGALDAFGIPVQMKKNRPGILLTVLCQREQEAKITDLIFRETSSLGVRRRNEQRQVLDRNWVTVNTQWGEVRMKVASRNGAITNYAPEYEDCRRIASEHQVPLKTVMEQALALYLQNLK